MFQLRKTLTNFLLPAFGLFMFCFALAAVSKDHVAPRREASMPMPVSNFKRKVAGLGIVEPSTRLINISANTPGVLTKLYVTPGDKVSAGDFLFSLDERATLARLKEAKANLNMAQVNYEDAQDSLALYENVKDKRAISINQLRRQKFAAQKAQMSFELAKAQVEALETSLDLLITKALTNGTILKVNANLGEFIKQEADTPPVIIGDLETLNVRVAVDDADISRVDESAPAVGILRGNNKRVPLKFVRIEPYGTPKINLSTNVREKIDTRVIEIIYTFNSTKTTALPGQQMDVFIKSAK